MAYGTNAPFGLRPFASNNGGSWTINTWSYTIAASADGQTTYATSIYTGDPVVFTPTAAQYGNIARYLPNYADAAPSTFSTLPILGVFQGCEYLDSNNNLVQKPFWPASTLVYPGSKIRAYVLDDTNVIYDIQVSTHVNAAANAFASNPYFPDPNATVALSGSFGSNFALNIGGGTNFTTVLDPNGNPYANNPTTGNTITGESAFYLDVSTKTGGDATHDYNKTIVTLPLKAKSYTTNVQNIARGNLTIETTPFLNVLVMLNNVAFGNNTPGVTLA